MLHALIFAADTLVILHWAKDLGAKEPISLWLEGTIVDGLGLLYLAM
jgi:hypothetical protein